MTQVDSLAHSTTLGEAAVLSVVAKRKYHLSRRRLEVAGGAVIVRESLRRTYGDDTALVHDSDLDSPLKPFTDVVLSGHAYSHRGHVRELSTGLRIGPMKKMVSVTGDRSLELGSGGAVTASAPARFSVMPVDWERAYGGRDRASEDPEARACRIITPETLAAGAAYSYPRNRVGVGFYLDRERERLEGTLLPNLWDPSDPVDPSRVLAASPNDWADRPVAAGYGPIDELTFPRCLFFGLGVDLSERRRPLREVVAGALAQDELDSVRPFVRSPRAFNCASPGLATHRLNGNERVSLWNLHRDHELLEVDLPGERPRLLIEPPGTRTFELEAKLATVFIEPDEDRITLTWAGAMPVAAVFPAEMCAEMRHAAVWS